MAHAVLTGSVPPRNAILTEPPREIRLQFNARLEGKVTQVTLYRGEMQIAPIEVVPIDKDNWLVVRMPSLDPGVYTLRYKVLAADGHLTEGMVRFTILQP